MLTTSSSSFTASTCVGTTMLAREVTPLGEASSFERTESLFGERDPMEDTSSPAPVIRRPLSISTVVPMAHANPKKRNKPNPLPSNPGPSNIPKNTKRSKYPTIIDPEYSWVFDEVAKHDFEYNIRGKVTNFVSVFDIYDELVVDYVVARSCKADERVYMKPRLDRYDFVYVYEYLFKEYDITFPLTNFEAGMLSVMNIALSQLYLNSWAFLKCFELLCRHLGFKPSINFFTHFYQMKCGKLVSWVSLSASYDGPSFTLYSGSYKDYKTKFFKLRCHLEDTERRLLFQFDFSPWLPFILAETYKICAKGRAPTLFRGAGCYCHHQAASPPFKHQGTPLPSSR